MKKIYNLIKIILILIALFLQDYIKYNNISIFLYLILIILLFIKNKDKKIDKITIILSCIFFLFISLGNNEIALKYQNILFIYYILCFIGYYFLFSNILLLFDNYFNKIIIKNNINNINKKKLFIILILIGLIMYIPYLLKYYPGIFSDDTYSELMQIKHIIPYGNHHPILFTYLISIFYNLGYFIFKNDNGIVLYTIFQMLLVILVYSYVIYKIYKYTNNKYILYISILYYFFIPFNALYSISLYKDILFSLLILLLIIFMYDNNSYNLNNKKKIYFIILLTLISLLRTNGKFMIILLFIYLLLFKRDIFKKIYLLILIALFITFSFNTFEVKVLKVTNVEFVESLSIPLQNISYTIINNGNISDSEYDELNKYLDINNLKLEYDNDFSDPVKNNLRKNGNSYLENNKLNFIKLWFNIGIKNIDKYLISYIYQTRGYWYYNYPVNHVYDEVQKDDFGIVHKNLLGSLFSKIINLLIYINMGIQHVLISNSLIFYIILLCLYNSLKNNKKYIYILPVIFVILTLLIATPVGYEFRYFYPAFITMPYILIMTIKEKM